MVKVITKGVGDSDGVMYKALPTDTYPMRISGVDIKESNGDKTRGQSMLELNLVVEGGHEYEGGRAWYYQMLPDDSCDDRQNSMRISGLAMIQIAAGLDRSDEIDTDDLMGCQVSVDVKEVPKKGHPGEFTNSVGRLYPAE